MVVGKHIHLSMEAILIDLETTTNDSGQIIIQDENNLKVDKVIDVTGLTFAMPIVKLRKAIESI